MRIVSIEECNEGYLVKGGVPSKTYAVSKDRLVHKVKELLGITDRKLLRKVSSKAPMGAKTDTNVTTLFVPSVSTDKTIETGENGATFVLKECSFPVSWDEVLNNVGKISWRTTKEKDKICITRYGYGGLNVSLLVNDLKKLYDMNSESERTDVLTQFKKDTYSNKATILRGFLREVPFERIISPGEVPFVSSSSKEKTKEKEEPKGQEDGSCDDVSFDSCANNNPEICKFCVDESRYEDKRKAAAKKPSPPLLKAHIGI